MFLQMLNTAHDSATLATICLNSSMYKRPFCSFVVCRSVVLGSQPCLMTSPLPQAVCTPARKSFARAPESTVKVAPRTMVARTATESTRVALANVLAFPCKLQLRVPIVAAKDVNDLVELNSQFETLNTLVVAFNGGDDPATLPYKSALGTLYISSSLTSCGAPVWHSFDKSLWIHKDSSNTWRVGAGLGCGTTYLLSDSAGGITPPVQNWSTPDGEPLPSEDVLVVEATLWGSLAVHKLKQFQCQPTSLFVDDPVEEMRPAASTKKRWSSNVYQIEDDEDDAPTGPPTAINKRFKIGEPNEDAIDEEEEPHHEQPVYQQFGAFADISTDEDFWAHKV